MTIAIPMVPSEEMLTAWDTSGATAEAMKLADAMPV